MLELSNGDARLVVQPDNGGRISSFTVGDLQLLRTAGDDPRGMHWGSFVMAPWAGRTRRGRFVFDGVEHQLPINAGAHAIHGTVRDQAWNVADSGSQHAHLTCDFGPNWPFAGWAEHTITLHADRVDLQLSMHAANGRMPAVGGWHPWWQRELTTGASAQLELPAGAMYVRDEEGIAVSQLVPPSPGPWDDCFTDLSGPPVLTWDDALELVIESDCPCVVVYDEPAEAICVEPQSAPPDALNADPAIAEPERPVVVHSSWRWRR